MNGARAWWRISSLRSTILPVEDEVEGAAGGPVEEALVAWVEVEGVWEEEEVVVKEDEEKAEEAGAEEEEGEASPHPDLMTRLISRVLWKPRRKTMPLVQQVLGVTL